MGSPRPQRSAQRPRSPNAQENLITVASRLRTPVFVSEREVVLENEVIALFEHWLELPLKRDSEEGLLSRTGVDGTGAATDDVFPPSQRSVEGAAAPGEQAATSALPAVTWARVWGELYLPSQHLAQIVQGPLTDAWFLGALAAAACKPDLLLDLVVSDDHAAHGLYTFQFYKHGQWHPVVVDSWLPCLPDATTCNGPGTSADAAAGVEDASNGGGPPNGTAQRLPNLAFARSGSSSPELWPSLLEKAYAKLHGSYRALSGGSVVDALTDVTGGACSKQRLEAAELEADDAKAGALWDQLVHGLGSGYVLACQHKLKGAAPGTQAHSGLLLNRVYSILDSQVLADGTKLLRLHSPWPDSTWEGSWAWDEADWQSTGDRRQLHSRWQSPTTFCMAFRDFIHIFNRLYIAQIFPHSWHQLTLHCGWFGPSAGGPHALPGGGLSSTWCRNPQFRLAVTRSCEVVLCVAQQDLQMQQQRRVRKRDRTLAFGFMLLQADPNNHNRIWELHRSEILHDSGTTTDREVTYSFAADACKAYLVVPYTRHAGEESPFVLRVFGSSPLELEQLPSPLTLTLRGQWAGGTAGGGRDCCTWGSNPQYMLSVQRRTRLIASLTRLDMRNSLLPAPHVDPCEHIRLSLVRPEVSSEGLGRRAAVRHPSELYAESGSSSAEEAVLVVDLEPEMPLLLVPSTAGPGVEAPFELRLMSPVPMELLPLPQARCVVHTGAWEVAASPDELSTAGGCDLHPTWPDNPRFLLQLQRRTLCKICLSRLKGPWRKNQPLAEMIGFYICRASNSAGDLSINPRNHRRCVMHESPLVPLEEIAQQYELLPNITYVIMPCTYAAKVCGRFTLAVTAQDMFDLKPLPRLT